MGSFEFVYTEDGQQQRFSFDSRDLSIGRSPDADFVLDHPTVSRQHARLIDEGGGTYRLVVQSEKGLTAVDGQQVSGEVRIQDGAELYFGRLQFQFRTRADSQPQGGDSRAGGQTQQSAGRAQQSAQRPQESQAQQSGAGAQSQGEPSGAPGGGSQWDSYEDEVADDPVGGAAGDAGGGQAPGGGPPGADGTSGQSLSPGGGEGAGEPAEKTEQEQLRETVGIESWDDIAESAEDDDKDADLPGDGDGEEEEESTNPLLIVAAAGALAFVGWTFISGTQFVAPDDDPNILDDDAPPMEIQVDCLAPDACVRKAKQSYDVGVEMLKKPDAEVTNLFNGYKKLLEAEALMKKAGDKARPPKMKDLEKRKKDARAKLDQLFRNFRVKYRSAKKEGNARAMVEALRTIQAYFPNKTSQEYRWAREQILRLKEQNRYPTNM